MNFSYEESDLTIKKGNSTCNLWEHGLFARIYTVLFLILHQYFHRAETMCSTFQVYPFWYENNYFLGFNEEVGMMAMVNSIQLLWLEV